MTRHVPEFFYSSAKIQSLNASCPFLKGSPLCRHQTGATALQRQCLLRARSAVQSSPAWVPSKSPHLCVWLLERKFREMWAGFSQLTGQRVYLMGRNWVSWITLLQVTFRRSCWQPDFEIYGALRGPIDFVTKWWICLCLIFLSYKMGEMAFLPPASWEVNAMIINKAL